MTPYSCHGHSVWVSGETLTLPGGCKPTLKVCITFAGPSLEVFDTSKAMDLGLPAINAPAQWGIMVWGRPQLGRVCRRQRALGVHSEVTVVPVVPAGIVRRILRRDYVDMAVLSEKNC